MHTYQVLFAQKTRDEYYVKHFRFPEEHKMTRRSSSLTDFGCHNHMTGLAAASLSLFIRENIENELGRS